MRNGVFPDHGDPVEGFRAPIVLWAHCVGGWLCGFGLPRGRELPERGRADDGGRRLIFAFPVLGHYLNLTDMQYGIFSGAVIQAVPQVIAAGFAFSVLAGQVATIVKMVRQTGWETGVGKWVEN